MRVPLPLRSEDRKQAFLTKKGKFVQGERVGQAGDNRADK
jgi:hypothetical protein